MCQKHVLGSLALNVRSGLPTKTQEPHELALGHLAPNDHSDPLTLGNMCQKHVLGRLAPNAHIGLKAKTQEPYRLTLGYLRGRSRGQTLAGLSSANPWVRCAAAQCAGRLCSVSEAHRADALAERLWALARTGRGAARAGAAAALGAVLRARGARAAPSAGALPVLVALAQDGAGSGDVQVWSLHALSLMADAGGPMFRSCVDPTLAMALKLLFSVPAFHEDIHRCIGRLLSALITVVGPELQDKCKKPNEVFACGSACDSECSTIGKTCDVVNKVCTEKCYCRKGYSRNIEGECVRHSQCPGVPTCNKDKNEEYSCHRTCPPKICVSVISLYACPKEPECKFQCDCKDELLRNSKGECVSRETCLYEIHRLAEEWKKSMSQTDPPVPLKLE